MRECCLAEGSIRILPGQYFDKETGLHVMRDYDPGTGRYLEPDPIGFEGGSLNLFSYAHNNPIIYVDPTGLYCIFSDGGPVLRLFYTDNVDLLGGGVKSYVLGEAALGAGGQIEIRLVKSAAGETDPDNNLVRAYYRTDPGASFVEVFDTNPAADARLFRNVVWSQAEFRIFAPIPEPSTWMMLLAGVAVLGWAGPLGGGRRDSASARTDGT